MMRSYFKMAKRMTGVLVTHINEISSSREVLRKNDILLEVDGIPIQDDGEGILFFVLSLILALILRLFFHFSFLVCLAVLMGTIGMHINGFIALKNMNDKVSLKVLSKVLVESFNISVVPVRV